MKINRYLEKGKLSTTTVLPAVQGRTMNEVLANNPFPSSTREIRALLDKFYHKLNYIEHAIHRKDLPLVAWVST